MSGENWVVPTVKGNYRGIKIMRHTMKLWGRVLDYCIQVVTNIRVNAQTETNGGIEGSKEKSPSLMCRFKTHWLKISLSC